MDGRLEDAERAARRALRLERTVEVRLAATVAVSALLEVATHRGEDPSVLAGRVAAWAERLPDGSLKGWMLWERALRLADVGDHEAALALTESMAEMNARALPRHPSTSHAVIRLGGLLAVEVKARRPDAAERWLADLEAVYAEEARRREETGHPELASGLRIEAAILARWRVEIAHVRGRPADSTDFESVRDDPLHDPTVWYSGQKLARLEREQARLQAVRRPA